MSFYVSGTVRSIICGRGEPIRLPAMSAKRGNPNWYKPWPAQLGPPIATEFEMRVRQLHLTNQTLVTSAELRTWCENNRNRRYIPESLLRKWGITVDQDVGA